MHYLLLKKNNQNEFIELLGKVKDTLFIKIKRSKYFSIILDCSSDMSLTDLLGF